MGGPGDAVWDAGSVLWSSGVHTTLMPHRGMGLSSSWWLTWEYVAKSNHLPGVAGSPHTCSLEFINVNAQEERKFKQKQTTLDSPGRGGRLWNLTVSNLWTVSWHRGHVPAFIVLRRFGCTVCIYALPWLLAS